MSNDLYPAADTHSQWYANAPHCAGVIMDLSPDMVFVIHTTEGVGWWSYKNGTEAPTFTIWHGHGVRQHFPANMSARALENHPGGVQTNTQYAVQVELVGTCDRATAKEYGVIYWPEATDEEMSELVDLLVWVHQRYGLKIQSGLKWEHFPASYGSQNGVRMSGAEWLAFQGICGHQHVPEQVHGDPGDFPIERLMALVNAKINGTTPAPAVPSAAAKATQASTTKIPAPAPAAGPKILSVATTRQYVDGPFAGKPSGNIKLIQIQLTGQHMYHGPLDGVWNNDLSNAYRAYQIAVGLTGTDVDGKPGIYSLSKLMAWNQVGGATA